MTITAEWYQNQLIAQKMLLLDDKSFKIRIKNVSLQTRMFKFQY